MHQSIPQPKKRRESGSRQENYEGYIVQKKRIHAGSKEILSFEKYCLCTELKVSSTRDPSSRYADHFPGPNLAYAHIITPQSGIKTPYETCMIMGPATMISSVRTPVRGAALARLT